MTAAPEDLQLHQWIFQDKAVGEGLEIAAGPLAGQTVFGYTFSPGASRFCRLNGGGQTALMERNQEGSLSQVTLDDVFEMRLFGADIELHWVRRKAEKGHITVITDDDALAALMEPDNLAHFNLPPGDKRTLKVRCIDHSYLLWGVAESIDGDWTKLTSARVGTVWAPFAAEKERGRLALTAREYFATYEAGNVAFLRERLTGFRHIEANEARQEGDADERTVPESV